MKWIDVSGALGCSVCSTIYSVSAGRPVLLRQDNTVFAGINYNVRAPDPGALKRFIPALIPSPSVNLSRDRVLRELRAILDRQGDCSILVVGGGRQRTWLTPLLQAHRKHRVLYTDIDPIADIDIFCDAHDLPFSDHSFDAVITTAVLEHVLDPQRAALEIVRVSKLDGLLYSELPFMQQVHEGAYDFTRYSLSGHRRLFCQFREIRSGMVAGPGTALTWALESFALAFFVGRRSRLIMKAVVRISCFWLKYFDYLLENRKAAMDGAACTYFFGAKSTNAVSDQEIIGRYVGAGDIRRV